MFTKHIKADFDIDSVVKIEHLTKDYGKGRGIFDINFEVKKGQTFGYCGTNGAGKTTTLRNIMGFIKPDKGNVEVFGINPWKHGELINRRIGYLPGEIAFPAVENGSEFLKIQAEMLKLTDLSKAEKIINLLQLDPTADLKRMSKGMKQKTAICAAFMHSPDLLILDEPTTGLDPLMREAFIQLIKEEKAKGTTIIMSNHMFDELDETCDLVGFIKDGKLIDVVDVYKIHNRGFREYVITFPCYEDFINFNSTTCKINKKDANTFTYCVTLDVVDTEKFIDEMSKSNITSISENKYTLQNYFMEKVGGKE